ncbi:MAG: hypothetical protein LBN32_05060 [Helicobacteraceae bacterium]|jgi:hypothetical protein|nr:hypothetical protein [Helicobacteraceae bacterium]
MKGFYKVGYELLLVAGLGTLGVLLTGCGNDDKSNDHIDSNGTAQTLYKAIAADIGEENVQINDDDEIRIIKSVTLKKDHTVPKDVTLIIPHDTSDANEANKAVITAESPEPITVTFTKKLTIKGELEVFGELKAESGGVLVIGGDTIVESGGELSVGDANVSDSLKIYGKLVVGDTLEVHSGATIDVKQGNKVSGSGTIKIIDGNLLVSGEGKVGAKVEPAQVEVPLDGKHNPQGLSLKSIKTTVDSNKWQYDLDFNGTLTSGVSATAKGAAADIFTNGLPPSVAGKFSGTPGTDYNHSNEEAFDGNFSAITISYKYFGLQRDINQTNAALKLYDKGDGSTYKSTIIKSGTTFKQNESYDANASDLNHTVLIWSKLSKTERKIQLDFNASIESKQQKAVFNINYGDVDFSQMD